MSRFASHRIDRTRSVSFARCRGLLSSIVVTPDTNYVQMTQHMRKILRINPTLGPTNQRHTKSFHVNQSAAFSAIMAIDDARSIGDTHPFQNHSSKIDLPILNCD